MANTVEIAAVPVPFVVWQKVAAAFDPISGPTRARYRTVRSRLRGSGLTVQRRSGASLVGSLTVHSSLAVLSGHAHRLGDEETASNLAAAGAAIEARFSDGLREFLLQGEIDQLATSPFFAAAVRMTSAQLARLPEWRRSLFADGVIDQVLGDSVSVTARMFDGEIADLPLPRSAFTSALLLGAPLLIFREVTSAGSTLIEVLDAVPAATTESHLNDELIELSADAYARFRSESDPRSTQVDYAWLRSRAEENGEPRRTVRIAG